MLQHMLLADTPVLEGFAECAAAAILNAVKFWARIPGSRNSACKDGVSIGNVLVAFQEE
jgi:hypothetical protein